MPSTSTDVEPVILLLGTRWPNGHWTQPRKQSHDSIGGIPQIHRGAPVHHGVVPPPRGPPKAPGLVSIVAGLGFEPRTSGL